MSVPVDQINILNRATQKYLPSTEDKAAQVAAATEAKQINVGIPTATEVADAARRTELEAELASLDAQLQNANNYLDPNYKSDPDDIMSDKTARSLPGKALNAAGGVVNAAAGLVGDVLNTPKFVKDLYNASAQGTADLVEYAAPGLNKAIDSTYLGEQINKAANTVSRGLDTIATGLDKSGKVIAKSTQPLYNETNVNKLAAEFANDYDRATGFWDGAKNMVGTAIENPGTAVEIFITSLPQMVALAKNGVKGTSAFLAIVGGQVEETTAQFVEKHGREPTGAETAVILGTAIASVGIDKFESRFILGKPILDAVTENPVSLALAKAVDVATNSTAGKTIAQVPFGKTVAKGTVAAPAEAAQEASQTALTELGASQDLDTLTDPAFQKELAVSAGLGLGAGAVGGGGVQALSDTNAALTGGASVVGKVADKVALAVDSVKDPEGAIAKANEAGDPEQVAKIIAGRDFTKITRADRTANLKLMANALTEAENFAQQLPPEEQAAKFAELETLSNKFNDIVATHKDLIDKEEGIDPRKAVDSILNPTEGKPVDVVGAVDQILGSSAIKQVLTKATVDALLSDELFISDATPEQKAYLEAKQESYSTLDTVSKDIIEGDAKRGFKGITEYLEEAENGATIESEPVVDKAIASMEALRELIQGKIDRFEAAQLAGETTYDVYGDGTRIEPVDKKTAEVFIPRVQKDVAAIDAHIAEAKALKAATFNPENTTVSPVEVVPVSEPKVATAPQSKTVLKQTKKEAIVLKQSEKVEKKVAKVEVKKVATTAAVARVESIKSRLAAIPFDALSEKSQKNMPRLQELLDKIVAGEKLTEGEIRAVNMWKNEIYTEAKVAKETAKKVKQEALANPTYTHRMDGTVAREESAGETTGDNLLHSNFRNNKGETPASNLTVAKNKAIGLITKIHNLFTNINSTTVQEQLPELDPGQTIAFEHLKTFVNKFSDVINGVKDNIPLLAILSDDSNNDVTAKIMDKNPLTAFIQVDSNNIKYLNENLISTLAMVTYDWIGTQGQKTLFNNAETINAILGRNKEDYVSSLEFNRFGDIGTSRNSLAESLGAQIYRHLGIQVKPGIDGKFEKRLQIALGQFAIAAALESNLLVQTSLTGTEMNAWTGNNEATAKSVNFVRLKGNVDPESKDGRLIPTAYNSEIINNVKTSKDVFDTILEIEARVIKPLNTPSTNTPKLMKDTQQEVPKVTRDTVRKMQQTAYKAKSNMLRVLSSLGQDQIKEMYGYNPDVEGTVHITERKGAMGKNLGIERELQHVWDYLDENIDDVEKEFFFEYQVVKNNRIMETSNTISLQNSKAHRHIFGATNWEVTVDSETLRTEFAYAVSLAFGGKVDGVPAEESIMHFESVLADPQVQAAIDAVKASKNNTDITAEQQQAIIDIVLKHEGFHTLDALVALAEYHPTDAFDTNLAMETDGKTSGVIIGNMQAMIENDVEGILAAGGVFFDGNRDYGTWNKDPSNNDSYQRLAVSWSKAINAIEGVLGTRSAHITSIMGTMVDAKGYVAEAGRKLSKNPLLITTYGAAVQRVVEEFGEKVTAEVYANMIKNQNDKDAMIQLRDHIHAITGTSLDLPLGNAVYEYTMPPKVERALRDVVKATHGKALEEALDEQFKEFNDYRKTINDALKNIFDVFKVAYDEAIESAETTEGRALSDKEKLVIANELQHLQPIFKGPLSTEVFEDGIIAMKTEQVRTYNEADAVEIKYSKGLRNTQNAETGLPVKNSTNHISTTQYVDGGVSGMILAIHSIDSAVIQQVLNEYQILNMFDAQYGSLSEIVTGTNLYNKAFLEINANYNVVEAVQEAFNRAIPAHTRTESQLEMADQLQSMVDKVAAARTEKYPKIEAVTQSPHPGTVHLTDTGVVADLKKEFAMDEVIDAIGDSVLGSAVIDADGFIEGFKNVTPQRVTSATTEQIFDDISQIDPHTNDTPEHTAVLRNLLKTLVSGALDSLGDLEVKIKQAGNQTLGLIQGSNIYINSAVGTLATGSQMSAQEAYVHELIHAITETAINTDHNLRKATKKLYDRVVAEGLVTWEDFMARDASGNIIIKVSRTAEEAAAKERYNYIFANKARIAAVRRDSRTGHVVREYSNNYLHEFMAHALTNKQLRTKLSAINTTKAIDLKSGTILEKLEALYRSIVAWVGGRILGTNGTTMDDALVILAEKMAGIHSRKTNMLTKISDKFHTFDPVVVNKLNKWIFSPISDYRKANWKDKDGKVKKTLNLVFGLPELVQHAEFRVTVSRIFNNIGLTQDGFIRKLVTEVLPTQASDIAWQTLLRYSKKHIDQARHRLSEEVTFEVQQAFGRKFTEVESAAMNRVLLKTDLVSLLETFTMDEVVNLIADQQALNKEIVRIQQDLQQYGENGNYYIKQAFGLGQQIAQGVTTIDGQMLNAYNIANLTSVKDRTPTNTAEAEILIDQLATLYALDFTNKDTRDMVSDIVKEQMLKTEDNGMLFMMYNHKGYKEDSLKKAFGGNKAQMTKGYTVETYDPNVAIKVGTLEQEYELAQAGYKRVSGILPVDRKHTRTTDMYMYVAKGLNPETRLKGIASLTDLHVSGTTLADAYKNEGVNGGNIGAVLEKSSVKTKEARLVERQFTDPKLPTKKAADAMLIPIVNEQGETVGYRYMMSEANKVEFLDMDERFDVVFGRMHGSLKDKINTPQVNRMLVKLAHQDFLSGFNKDPSNYVEISTKSSDPKMKEIYDLLPYQAKQDIKAIWGKDRMLVRKELIDLAFGYKKASLTDMGAPKLFKDITDAIVGTGRFVRWIKTAEDVWQQVVKTGKDTIVVKLGVTLYNNIVSNNILLVMHGVSPTKVVAGQALALTALNDFMGSVTEKNALERKLKNYEGLSASTKANLEVQIANLNDDIKANPVKALIDEGVFQSIAEDIDVSESKYDYRAKLERTFKAYTDKVPGPVKKGYQYAYLTHDTKPYQLLLRGTQYSDFVARFTLYEHLLNKGVAKEAAIAEIIETFINYDVPTSKGLQYVNDMGVLMFTKYMLRTQRVIAKVLLGKPATALAAYSLQEMFGDVSDITDSNLLTTSVLARLSDPMDTIQAATHVAGLELLGLH